MKYVGLTQAGWKMLREPNYLTLGTALHRYAALRAQGVEQSMAGIVAKTMLMGDDVDKTMPWIGTQVLDNIFYEWEKLEHNYLWIGEGDKREPVVEFSLAYPFTPQDIATGTLDAIVRLSPKCLAFRDIKCTMKFHANLREYERSPQFLQYPMLLRKFMLEREHDPLTANFAKPSWLTPEIFEQLTHIQIVSVHYTKTGATISTHEFKIDWNLVTEYERYLTDYIGRFDPSAATGLLTGACMSGKGYPCSFIEACGSGYYGNLKQEPYNPIRRHKQSKVVQFAGK